MPSRSLSFCSLQTIWGARKSRPRTSRARQNVIMALGYFIARVGRDRVCPLVRNEVEKPSDYAGVVWVPLDSGAWKLALMKRWEKSAWNSMRRPLSAECGRRRTSELSWATREYLGDGTTATRWRARK